MRSIWEPPPESKRERGTFDRLQVNERIENPLVEIYQRAAPGKSVILGCKNCPKELTDTFTVAVKCSDFVV